MPSPPSTPPPSSDVAKAGRELYRDDYIVVHMEADGLLVWLVRTTVAYPDIAALVRSFEHVIATLDRAGRAGRAMLFDTRAARGRNDAEFERAMAALRPRIDRQFERVGVLLASAVGVLQMRRWVSDDGIERITATNADQLTAILRSELSSRHK